ncbi:MAG TPA: GspH/FimT family pseudopilin [Telluria sp.]
MVSRRPARGARGFTLPEILAVMAILAVLAAVAAPSFTQLIGTMRARSISSELYVSLARARSEAIKRNAEVTLAPQTDAAWQAGWHIVDPQDPSRRLDVHGALVGATVSGPANVVFLPNGRVKGADLPSFDIAVSAAGRRRCITVDLGGRPNQTAAACS